MISVSTCIYNRDVCVRFTTDSTSPLRNSSDIPINSTYPPNSLHSPHVPDRPQLSAFRSSCDVYLVCSGPCMFSCLPLFPFYPFSILSPQHPPTRTDDQWCSTYRSLDCACVDDLRQLNFDTSCMSRYVQLFIKSIRNTTISIHIDSTSSISDLKHPICDHDGIPPGDLRLLHRGRELRDAASLSGLDVDGATITCLLRVLGGNSRAHRIPLYWWFGFSRSYEDGRAGEEGRIGHVLSEFDFECGNPVNWYSDAPLSNWNAIDLHSGTVLLDCLDIFR